MIRVGFLLAFLDESWIGGLNYYRSLLGAISELPDRKIEPVIFTGTKTPSSLLKGFPVVERVQTNLLDRRHPRWMLRKLMCRITGNESFLKQELQNHGISVLSHFGGLGKDSPVKTIGWIQDFQHRKLPEFFSKKERARRDLQFKKLCQDCDVILLSSHVAQIDLAAFMPDCVEKSRVLQFVSDMGDARQATSIEMVRNKYGIEGMFFGC